VPTNKPQHQAKQQDEKKLNKTIEAYNTYFEKQLGDLHESDVE
jgi:hypothetical protein